MAWFSELTRGKRGDLQNFDQLEQDLSAIDVKSIQPEPVQLMGVNPTDMRNRLVKGLEASQHTREQIVTEIARLKIELHKTEVSIKAAKSALDVIADENIKSSRGPQTVDPTLNPFAPGKAASPMPVNAPPMPKADTGIVTKHENINV